MWTGVKVMCATCGCGKGIPKPKPTKKPKSI